MKDLIYINGFNFGAILTGENLIMLLTGVFTILRILIAYKDLRK